MPGIGIGISPLLNRGGGTDWSSYWATRTPSSAFAYAITGTAIDVTWTDAADASDGLKLYISTDNINWTLKDTVAFGVQISHVTGLTIDTRYYFKLVAYKGVNESDPLYSDDFTATYFVATTGSSTAPYDTLAKACTSLSTLLTYINTNGDGTRHVANLSAETWTTNIYLQGANQDNLVVAGKGETTIIDLNGRAIYHSNADSVEVAKVKVMANPGQQAYYGTNASKSIILREVTLEAEETHASIVLYSLGNHVTLYDCKFYGRTASAALVQMRGASNLNAYNCVSCAAKDAVYSGGSWNLGTTGTVNIDHCNILDVSTYGIYAYAAGTFNVKNSIITGCYYNVSASVIKRTNGTLTLTNNVIFPEIFTPTVNAVDGDYVDGGGNVLTNPNPKFKGYPRKGYIIPRCDDAGNGAYARAVGLLLAEHGMSMSYYMSQFAHSSADDQLIRDIIAEGNVEVGLHSYSHTDVGVTGKIFDVTKGAETITIDRTADTITLSGGGSVTGFKAKALSLIKTELEALGATVTPTAIYGGGTGKITTYCRGEAIDAGVGTNQIDILVDNTGESGYFKTEMKDPKAWLEGMVNASGDVVDPQTGLKYECRTWEGPFGSASADSRLALINLGFLGAGSKDILGYQYPNFSSVVRLDAYSMGAMAAANMLGASEAITRSAARAVAFAAAQTGFIMEVLSHNAAQVTLEQWGWIIDEWASFGSNIKVCSRQIALDEIKAAGGDWTDVGDGTYTREYEYGDYELDPTSDLVGAADDSGNIGAY